MVQMKILPVILSLYLFGFSKSQSTGILGKLNARGLEFGGNEMTAVITDTVMAIEFPAFTGTLLGVDFSIFNISITTFDLGETILLTEEPDTLVVDIRGASIGISGLFEAVGNIFFFFTNFNIDINGSASAEARDITLIQRITLQRNENGVLAVSSGGCEASIGAFPVRVSGDFGGFESVINSGIAAASGQIRDGASTIACDNIEGFINQLDETVLAGFNGQIDLPMNVSLDFTLPRPPSVTNKSIELSLNGRCYPTFSSVDAFRTDSFLIPAVFPLLSPSTSMFQLSISDYVVNTFLNALHYNRAFEIELNELQLRTLIQSPIPISNAFLKLLNRNLPGDFSSTNTDYTVIIRPQVVPRVQFRPGTFSIAAVFEADVDFPNEVGEYDSSLLLLAFNITANVTGSGRHLFWEIVDADFDIGGPPPAFLDIFNRNSRDLINSALNALTGSTDQNQFEIPAFAGFAIDITSIVTKQDAIELVTDITRTMDDESEVDE